LFGVALGTLTDGTTLLATGSADSTIRIWDPTTGQHLRTLTGHTNWVRSVAFGTLTDGATLLATGSLDHTIRIWNPATGKHLHTLTGHSASVPTVAFTTQPDGTTLLISVGGEPDRTVRIWNPITGQHLHTLSTPGITTLTAEPIGGDRIRIAYGTGVGDVEIVTMRVHRARPPSGGDQAPASFPVQRVPVAGLVRLGEADVVPPLGLLADLLAVLGGGAPVDGRLGPLAGHPGVERLRKLHWPPAARIGLAALLLADLPVDARFRAPDAEPGALVRALTAALRSPAVPPVAPDPPMVDLLAAAEAVGDRLLTLLVILGPDAVAADPALLLRLRDRAGALPAMDAPQRAVVANAMTVADRRYRADVVRYTASTDGISRRGPITHLLPTQLTMPPGLFDARYAAGELLYRQYSNGAAARPEPVTIVLDNSPATFGPPETVLRLVAHVITTTLWRGYHYPVLVSLDRADLATVVATPDELTAMWSARTLGPPDLGLALATAAHRSRTPVVVLTEHHAAREWALRPGPRLRLLTTHLPGDPPRRAPAGRYHVHLPPDAGPVDLTRAVARLLTVEPTARTHERD
jgi:hypothetical protein